MNENLFYIAFTHAGGTGWSIFNGANMDASEDLQAWITYESERRGYEVVPIFWKRLQS
jgi:hypothetical protein